MDALGSADPVAPPKILTQAAHRLFEASPALISWTIILSPIAVAFLFGWAGAFAVAVGVLVFDAYWLIRCFWVILGIIRTFRRMRRTMAVDWLARCREDEEAGSVHPLAVTHLCIIPTYTEPYAV